MKIILTNDKVPIDGYLMPLWNYGGYRATALAYMQREGLNSIENYNGKWYTISEIKNAIIGSNN